MVAKASLLNMYKPPILFLMNLKIIYIPYMHMKAIEAAEQEVLKAE